MNIKQIFTIFITKLIIGFNSNDSYLLNFILVYSFFYSKISNNQISFAVSLIYLFICTFTRYILDYSTAFVINTCILFWLIINYKTIVRLIYLYSKNIIFVGLTYIYFSLTEWIIHKYVMHCNKKSLFWNIISKLVSNNVINILCDHHTEHHLEVNPNMTLSKVKYKSSLFIDWEASSQIFIIIIIGMIITNAISGVKYSYKFLAIASFCVTILWAYIWNKIHPQMHKFKGSYSLNEGPYEEKINFNIINKIFYKNHQTHHIQKGRKKGNYNVIIFGADEWLGTNVKVIDNKEYCSNSQASKEPICKS